MQLETRVKGDTLIVKVFGELDLLVADEFRKTLDRHLQANPVKNLLLDLKGVSFLDSSGLGVILGRYKRLSRSGGRVAITGVQPAVRRVLELGGVTSLMCVRDKEI